MYYDLCVRRTIGKVAAKRFPAWKRVPTPEGHPLGFDLVITPDDLVSNFDGNNRNDDDDGPASAVI